MKVRHAVALGLLAFGAPGLGADCTPMAPPTALTARLIPRSDAQGPYTDVSIDWTRPNYDVTQVSFEGYRTERRDVTGGGSFGQVQFFASPNPGFTGYLDKVEDGVHAFAGALLPGHTYEYRVITTFTNNPQTCGNSDPGESSPSAPVSVDIPGPVEPPEPPAPRDVIAVSELKKPRVHVRWKAPEGPEQPVRYGVERRIVPSGDEKAEGAFAKVGEVPNDRTEFIDEFAVADEIAEYRVVAELLDGENKSQADAAYPASGEKCAVAKLDLWSGTWELEIGGESHTLEIGTGDTDKVYALLSDGSPSGGGGGFLRVTSLASRLRIDRTALAAASVVSRAEDGRPAWAKDLAVNQRGDLRLDMTPPDPFDPAAFVAVKGTIRFKKGPSLPVTGRRVVKETTFANVCSSIGAGVGKSANGRYLLGLGKYAVVVLDVMPVDFPLLPGRGAVDLTIDNGEVVLLAELTDDVRPVGGDPSGKSTVRFELGAIGASKKGVPQRARIVLAVTPAAFGKGQMTCTFKLVQLEATSFPAQIVNFTNKDKQRVVEFLVLPPG